MYYLSFRSNNPITRLYAFYSYLQQRSYAIYLGKFDRIMLVVARLSVNSLKHLQIIDNVLPKNLGNTKAFFELLTALEI